MAKERIGNTESDIIRALLEQGGFTMQDISNHLENRFTHNQLTYYIKKHFVHLKKNLKK